MKQDIENILQGDLEEARLNEICRLISKRLEWLRNRLYDHAKDGGNMVSLDFVDARVDDLKVTLK